MYEWHDVSWKLSSIPTVLTQDVFWTTGGLIYWRIYA